VQNVKETYHPESYWNKVAVQISRREDQNYIAGDDEPYYRYKRKKFLALFRQIDFQNKSVLEVGCGPGGNLAEVADRSPSRLVGVDLSREMLTLADRNLGGKAAELFPVTAGKFPFAEDQFDIVFTSTVLQHTTKDEDLRNTIAEMCRVGKRDIYIFERIEKKIKGNETCLGRTVAFYDHLFSEHGFRLVEKKFLFIQASYVMAGLTRKFLNRRNRKEGEKLSGLSLKLQLLLLPVTKLIDKIYRPERDVAMLHYQKLKDE
jgi:ubiquinone/menaquinone biosynthesis C-methylase UbiE